MKLKYSLKFLTFIKVYKTLLLIFIDLMSCILSIWLALYIRLDTFYPIIKLPIIFVLLSTILLILIFIIFDIYKTINRFSGWGSFIQLGKSLIVYNLIFFFLYSVISFEGIPRSIGLLHPIIITLIILTSRALIRVLLGKNFKSEATENILIYGAGEAGRQLASIINYSQKMNVLGFLEDDKELIGNKINNKLIYSSNDLKKIKDRLNISTLILAIPSLDNKTKSKIIKNIQQNKIAVKTLPTLSELENGDISLSDLRPLNINELLGRKKVDTSDKKKSDYILNKTILITGAGGSIGSELCKQVLEQAPSKIILLDISEFSLYKINQILNEFHSKNFNNEVKFIPILASIQDKKALENVFKKYKPNIIYHAAAYKHVPLVQINPIEGIKNNILGTELLADLAIKYNVDKFVLISSDKAVRPTNIMGASKRFSELILQSYNQSSIHTIFTIVRFGNVLGSSGSVVPRFQEQIKQGGPVTLTHENVTRFFMTKEEAIHLIIQAGGMSLGGEVFILKMGEPIKILELAKTMIYLSGKTIKDELNQNGDIEINITGLRQGEKMYEELLIGNNPIQTENNKILKANETFYVKEIIANELKNLKKHINNFDMDEINKMFTLLITGYKDNSSKKKNEKS
jgi:FlaA1/EpsC-like NDP-sugar epimerase